MKCERGGTHFGPLATWDVICVFGLGRKELPLETRLSETHQLHPYSLWSASWAPCPKLSTDFPRQHHSWNTSVKHSTGGDTVHQLVYCLCCLCEVCHWPSLPWDFSCHFPLKILACVLCSLQFNQYGGFCGIFDFMPLSCC